MFASTDDFFPSVAPAPSAPSAPADLDEPFPTAVAAPDDAPAPSPEALDGPAPEETHGDDLTVISSIDAGTQRLLREAGVHTLDEIARWGRGEARRVSAIVQVSEETIFNQWVFEAQAALFNQFAQQNW